MRLKVGKIKHASWLVPLQKGFGNIDGEHWLGLDNIYNLGKQGDYKLMVELEDWTGKKVYAEYSSFRLESESEGYRLRLGTYQGNAGDSFSSHNGKQFTSLDRDKDAFSGKMDTKGVPESIFICSVSFRVMTQLMSIILTHPVPPVVSLSTRQLRPLP